MNFLDMLIMMRTSMRIYIMAQGCEIIISFSSGFLSWNFYDFLIRGLTGNLWFIRMGDKGKGKRSQSFSDSHELAS